MNTNLYLTSLATPVSKLETLKLFIFSIIVFSGLSTMSVAAPITANGVDCLVYQIYYDADTIIYVLALMLMTLGAAIYAGANIAPSHFKGNFQSYGMGMIIGGVIAVIIGLLAPFILGSLTGGVFQPAVNSVAQSCGFPSPGGGLGTGGGGGSGGGGSGGSGLIEVESKYGFSFTSLTVPGITTISFSENSLSGVPGTIDNPYEVANGWIGPGYYIFPRIGGNETSSPVNTVADLDIYNLALFGNNLGAPYYDAYIVSGNPYG